MNKLSVRTLSIILFMLLFLPACSSAVQTGTVIAARLTSPVASSAPQASTSELQVISTPLTSAVEAAAPTATTEAAGLLDLENQLIDVYQQPNPAVVYIITAQGSGSGFVYSQDGYIVTNNHVVSGSRAFEIVFADGTRLPASLVGSDLDSDLAVLQVEALPEGVSPLLLAESDELQVGQLVVAIGNPFGEQGSMSMGIVSGLGRSLPSQRTTTGSSTYSLPEVIQTDAPINPGNSGGPLLNLQGEVVGVNAAIATTTESNSGVGFSIPVGAVRLVVPQLIQTGSYDYAYLGASFDGEISLSDQSQYGLGQMQGAYLLSVTPGGPAARAGLVAADSQTGRGGDLITAMDGEPIREFAGLNGYLVFHTRPGQEIQVAILRNGEQLTLPLVLGSRP